MMLIVVENTLNVNATNMEYVNALERLFRKAAAIQRYGSLVLNILKACVSVI